MGSAHGVRHKYKIEWSLSQLSVEAHRGKKGLQSCLTPSSLVRAHITNFICGSYSQHYSSLMVMMAIGGNKGYSSLRMDQLLLRNPVRILDSHIL